MTSWENTLQYLKVILQKAEELAHQYPADYNDVDFETERQHLLLENKKNWVRTFRIDKRKLLEMINLLRYFQIFVFKIIVGNYSYKVASAENFFSVLFKPIKQVYYVQAWLEN